MTGRRGLVGPARFGFLFGLLFGPPFFPASLSSAAAGEGVPAPAPQEDAAPDCSFRFLATEVHEGFVDERERVSRVRLTVWYSDPGTSIHLVSPYYGSAHSDIRSLPRPLAFLSDFSFERSGVDGRLQRLTISWLGELELAIRSPGCAPVPLRCDERTCTG